MDANKMGPGRRVLISGASFAGLATAKWMRRLGYEVTVVELAPALRRGGTPVDVNRDHGTVAVADRMGILSRVKEKALPPRAMEFTDGGGTAVLRLEAQPLDENGDPDEYEIHRDDLMEILFAEVEGDVEFLFGDSITELTDVPDGLRASFRSGGQQEFAFVLGCDGSHSTVRRLRFGPEAEYSRFLHNYYSVAIVDGIVIPASTTRIENTPGRTVMLNSYEDTTDIVLAFHSEQEIPYDYHDVDAQKQLLQEHYADASEADRDLLARSLGADNFYFTKLEQIRMPGWISGRVALVGDAAHCPSPAGGRGGSLALLGAAALYDAFIDTEGDVEAAFEQYERSWHPVVEQLQDASETVFVPMIFPDTAEAISARNAQLLQH